MSTYQKFSPWKFFLNLLKAIQKDELLLFAQGLTFTTILTIIPITGLVLSIARIFIPQEKIIDQTLVWIANYLTPEATSKVVNIILELIQKLKDLPLGKFSIVAYFLMSLGIFFQVEDSLNKIFKSSKRRTFVQRLSFYWLCMTITPFLLFLPFSFHSLPSKLITPTALLSFTIFFFLMYIYFPARKVPKKEALIGALFSAVLWGISSYLYGIYIKHAIAYSKLYGSLSAVPLFLIWLFINWLIFLLGAELAVFMEKKGWYTEELCISTSWTRLCILYQLAKAFLEGSLLSLQQLSQKLHLSPSYLEPFIEELEKEGILLVSEEGKIALLKSPDKLTLNAILKLDFTLPDDKLPIIKEIKEKLEKISPSIFKTTLKDLVEKN
jgi:membrane protein